ncbi:MAG: cytochrome P450 [Acidobacteriaceae bacterium]|nr:cytochrome P450 [Acidobacteriaceae bacterium]
MQARSSTKGDPLLPPPPGAPYYDSAMDTWVLSRHADVSTALREPRLRPTGPRSDKRSHGEDPIIQARVRAETLAALSPAKLSAWQAEVRRLLCVLVDELPRDRPVDIVHELAEPGCLAIAVLVTGADPLKAQHLGDLARKVSAGTSDAKAANAELAQYFQNAPIPMSGPAFVALSQTLPRFLANAWLALLRHPAELARLDTDANLLPKAIEELLRYAGVAQKLSRQAGVDIELAGIRIPEGERLRLMLASANRDPTQFPEPNRLDLTRNAAGHVGLGAGMHSCAGGALVRMAAGVATGVFVENIAAADIRNPVEWRGGSGFRSAASLYVLLRR